MILEASYIIIIALMNFVQTASLEAAAFTPVSNLFDIWS